MLQKYAWMPYESEKKFTFAENFERGNIKSNLLIKTNLVLTVLEWKI